MSEQRLYLSKQDLIEDLRDVHSGAINAVALGERLWPHISGKPIFLPQAGGESFQSRVHAWVVDFFPEHGVNVPERARRFVEEAIELAQAVGLEGTEVQRILDRAYSRPAGEPLQELGGSMVSLAALAEAVHLDAEQAGEIELRRISAPGMRESMRAKQAEKRAEGVGE